MNIRILLSIIFLSIASILNSLAILFILEAIK
jgi:hypothetical protein